MYLLFLEGMFGLTVVYSQCQEDLMCSDDMPLCFHGDFLPGFRPSLPSYPLPTGLEVHLEALEA